MRVVRRPAAVLGSLAVVSLLATASPALAAPPTVGTASATTAGLGLDVRLLNSTVDVPISSSLNAVRAPGSSDDTLLTTTVQGSAGGTLTLLQAKIAHTTASADTKGSHALVDLVGAQVDAPGLLGVGLLGLDEVHAQADCPVGGRPSAEVDVLGELTVLGRTVSLSSTGPSQVTVPGIGSVTLWESKKTVTSTTAAATALELQISVNPLKLNIAEVTGTVELAAVGCSEPVAPISSASVAPAVSKDPSTAATASAPAAPADPTNGTTSLAETGGGGDAAEIAGAAVLLLGAGVGSLALSRRRRRS
jgi:hypothetical protein